MRITGAVLEETGRARPYARSRPITVCELELGDPGPTEVLVAIEAAGVCHSDLSVVDGNRPRPLPMLLGHEAAGTVVSTGERVADLVPGQRVVMSFLPRCEECDACARDGQLPCSAGSATNNAGELLHHSGHLSRGGSRVRHHLGVSGFASHAIVDRASVVPVGSDVPPEIAALFGCAVLTGGGAVLNVARPGPLDTVMVVGLGGVGMATLLTAKAVGVEHVIGVDRMPEKLAAARELGATATYTPDELRDNGVRARYVIESAGHPSALESAYAATEPGGITITVGLPAPAATMTLPPLSLTAEARTLGSYLGSAVPARDIPRYERMWREGRLPVEKLISARIELADINEAMDLLADGRAVRQVIIFDRK
ncbi:alcohol dehydrogenase catalytic domain-containing protein [Nocardia sp. SYP-A9097]|uniref:alcohol dehydrogenase catalytic domain-containing protein n=1 Tax=Nocardia sp. SYP-A9097 TaxID=2663237 RepID=UPI00129B4C3A|nr:alcohol dehydrogenase catalytic domain-containing protein [Nocardia sp. SYP-A9097]MRH88223.1 alcohol dehydrogenase catalytic domain-containing protein [Nocardia sp. SYP-A9097]